MEYGTMEHRTPRHAAGTHHTGNQPGPGPRELAPGARLARWLTGRTRLLWIDSLAGRLVMRIMLALGARPVLAWPGPVLRTGAPGHTAPLSWYEIRAAGDVRDSFMAVLSKTLTDTPRPDSRRVAALMHRVLQSFAGSNTRAISGLASGPSRYTSAHVAIIDERLGTAHPFGHPGRTRALRFERMMNAALARHPDGQLWLVRSADPGRGPWLSEHVGIHSSRVRLLAADCAFAQVLRHTDHVYTLTASEGLLALIANITVHVFGSPCYAGWGLTDDYYPLGGRHARPTREALFEALFVSLPRYLDPETHRPGTLEAALASLELQRELAGRFPGLRAVAAVGFARGARRALAPFLRVGAGAPRWVAEPWQVRHGECAVLAGMRSSAGLSPNVAHVRMAGGLLQDCLPRACRSSCASQVIDYSGIYLDARSTCDLIMLLNHGVYTDAELARARALRECIVNAGRTQHAARRQAPPWRVPPSAKMVLVAGQASDDPTLLADGGQIFSMHALLQRVRTLRPDAWLVYRPHPHERLAGAALNAVLDLADVVDTHAEFVSLIAMADEIHTISSPFGFSALLHGKAVFTWGTPFYAGWGLTHDAVDPLPWRARRITLDTLVAGTLLRYALYHDAQLHCFTSPEAIVQRMADACARAPGAWQRASRLARCLASQWLQV
jgi:capsular polysaccharide export protein